MVLAATFVVACARDARPPKAPVDLAVPPIGKALVAPTSSEPHTPETCHARLSAGFITKSSFGCVIDEQISKTHGTLDYPCAGDGDAEAVFGTHTYAGRVHEGQLELEVKTEFDWDGDRCHWGTTANIRGRIADEAPLAWTYRDYVLRGTSCSGTCTARSSFQVRQLKQGEPIEEEIDAD